MSFAQQTDSSKEADTAVTYQEQRLKEYTDEIRFTCFPRINFVFLFGFGLYMSIIACLSKCLWKF